MKDERIRLFVELTTKAMEEEDIDNFIEYLARRSLISDKIIKCEIKPDEEDVRSLVELEKSVLERLEYERKLIIQEAERLSNDMKAVKSYTAKFPFPVMPAFFSKSS